MKDLGIGYEYYDRGWSLYARMSDKDSNVGDEEFYASYKKGQGNGELPALFGGNKGAGKESHSYYQELKDGMYWLRDDLQKGVSKLQLAFMKLRPTIKTIRIASYTACLMSLLLFADRMFFGTRESDRLFAVEEAQKELSDDLEKPKDLSMKFDYLQDVVRKDLITTSNLTHQTLLQVEVLTKEKNAREGIKVVDGYKENENLTTLRMAYHQAQEELKFLRYEVKQLREEVTEFRSIMKKEKEK